jgi:hypothetical protein
MYKYQNARKLSDKMTRSIPIDRPNCKQILESKHLWALDKNELEINDELSGLLEEKSKDKQSIYHMIYTKLNIN